MGILDGKRILVAGVTMDSSIGFAAARGRPGAGRDGADLQLRPRARHHQADRQAAAAAEPPVLELDVTDDDHLAGSPTPVREHVDGLDGVVHSIAYGNPETLLGGKFLDGPVGRRGAGGAGVGVLPDVAGRGLPAADEPGGVGRRDDLRRHRRLAGVRLDGRGQGRPRVVLALPRPRPRPAGHPGATWSPPAR